MAATTKLTKQLQLCQTHRQSNCSICNSIHSKEQQSTPLLAAVEAGGTTFVLSVVRLLHGDDLSEYTDLIPSTPFQQISQTEIPTTTPSETLTQVCTWLQNQAQTLNPSTPRFDAIGVTSFGPVDLATTSSKYGYITTTPKKKWQNINLLKPILLAASGLSFNSTQISQSIKTCFDERLIPHKFDTDVNAPALAEFYHSNSLHKNNTISSCAYITVGTGVGVGLIINAKPVHGLMHPEGGHVLIKPLSGDDFTGYSWGKNHSPYDGTHTIEGTASSIALLERVLQRDNDDNKEEKERDLLKTLSDNHSVWDHCANALANLCVSLVLLTSIEKIVLGGGVMKRKVLYDKIRKGMVGILNGYIGRVNVMEEEDLREFICESTWGDRAGIVGAMVLAKDVWEEKYDGNSGELRKDEIRNGSGWWKGFVCGGVIVGLMVVLSGRINRSCTK